MKKRIVSLLLVLSMVVGMIPYTVSATTPESKSGTVYISISDDAQFVTAPDGTAMGFFPVKLEDLAQIDLDDYGLAGCNYDVDSNGIPEITALHLYIYAHEEILNLDWSNVYVTGGAGSIYLAGGLFGFSDENLRYDYNGAYPAVDGWGLTADQIVLKDGDFMNIAHYSSWAFWGDSATGFHYFTDGEGELQHTYQVSAGKPLELGIVRSFSDWTNGGAAAFNPEIGYEVYYGRTYGQPEGRVYSNEDGKLEITFPSSGTWYVWANGGLGNENTRDIVSAPAFATVKVPDLQITLDLTELSEPICYGGIMYDDLIEETAEAGKKSEYGFSVADYDTYILYVDFYDDSAVIGFDINGTNYFAEDPGEGYVDWELGNDTYAGYAFGYQDENGRGYHEFYFQLGYQAPYNIPGNWVITPLVLTEEVVEVIIAIDDIYVDGEVITLESGDAIALATTLYNALTDTEKEVVAYLEMTQVLEAAQEAYNALLSDQTAANEVAARINAIGTVELSKEEAITAARAAYNALSDARKALVSNYATLTAAEERLQQLKDEAEQALADQAAAEAVKNQITAIGTVTAFSGTKIQTARAAYDKLTDSQKALVQNVDILTDAEAALAAVYKQTADTEHKAIYNATADYLSGLGTPYVGSTGGEWMVIAMTRAGQACPAGYYDNVIKFVKENINDKEQLHRAKSTENSRVILALTAAGYDVTNVDGHNLLKGLTDMSYVKKQGINGPIWALIAFDSHSYEIPAGGDVTREKLIQTILDAQLSDGGWNLSGQTADPDMTGMALQALAPYCKSRSNTDVQAAVDKALECLSRIQHDNGGYGSIDGVCAESCAQVIVALTSLGIDPETDSRFIKNGISVVDAMCLYAVNGGGFAHVPGGKLNGMATEQSQYALVSCMRLKNGKTALYNMSDVQIKTQENQKPEQTQKPQEPPKTEETQNPQETQKPQDTQKPGHVTQPVTPYTGDTAQPMLWAVIMLLSLCGTVVFFLLRRRIVS